MLPTATVYKYLQGKANEKYEPKLTLEEIKEVCSKEGK